MTTTTTTASRLDPCPECNGSGSKPGSPATGDGTKPKPTGMARVQETYTWSTASVMHDAAMEAERLCGAVYNAIHDAYFDTKTAASTAVSDDDIRAKAEEARRCLYAAANYLSALIGDGEPPS
jgi:hypothetical protein